MKQKQSVSKAANENNRLASLKKNIERVQETYLKDYQEAYSEAWKLYEEEVKAKWDGYNQQKDDALKDWCSDRDPAITNPDDPCNQPPVFPLPNEMPEFVFSFEKTEMAYLKERIKDDNIDLINYVDNADYHGPDVEDVPPGEQGINTSSFQKVHQNIDKAIAKNRDIIVSNTVNEGLTVVSVAGVPVNVSQRPAPSIGDPGTPNPPPPSANFVFKLCPNIHSPGNYLHFDLQVTVPDSSWQYSSIEYTHLNPATGPFENNVVYSREGNTMYLSDLFHANNTLPLDGGSMLDPSFEQITGYVYFTNGSVKSFIVELKEGVNYKTLTGWFGFEGKLNAATSPHNTSEPEPPTNPPGNPGTNNPSDKDASVVFKPSGFGVKQLGIADYRKVEQTVHCYVEGEVAHIENVMAREYREKSTRRLRRSETTNTTSSESEREQLTDTTSTDRFEMQNEVAKVLQESKDFSLNTSFRVDALNVTFDNSAGFAAHNSKEESIRSAVTHAKDITERAMDRVVSRVKQERVEKIIEEFEENNKHGFDNTRGDKHVVGVYRWVDKIYKNQVYNYGRRLMFEFMIPEPGKLHTLGMKDIKDTSVKVIAQPVDPRTASSLPIKNYNDLNEDSAKYWSGIYNVEIESKPAEAITVSKTFSFSFPGDSGGEFDESAANNADIELPFGYRSKQATTTWNHPDENNNGFRATAGTENLGPDRNGLTFGQGTGTTGFTGSFPVSFSSVGYHAGNINFRVDLELTPAGADKWKQQTFNAIIEGYEKALAKYEEQIAVEKTVAETVKATNPGFYRQIENTVLRKNCISYLIDQKTTAPLTYGKPMYKAGSDSSFLNYEINVTKALNDYTAFAKFLEQAFEWDIISYYLYPYYWGSRTSWQEMYQYDNTDPLFRSFMQSGLARVVVTVRPGFEDAVRFYMQTGLIWNGGEVPVIDEPLHLAIIDELRAPLGKPEGKAWATRVPTSLTILQANSIGLVVDKALPCNCDDVSEDTWENASAVPCGENFVLTNDKLGSGTDDDNNIEFYLRQIEEFSSIGQLDDQGLFPRKYRCMGQVLEIERNPAWLAGDDSSVLVEALAANLSQIAGVDCIQEVVVDNASSLHFTIDSNLHPIFSFGIVPNDSWPQIVTVSSTIETVQFDCPGFYAKKLFDKAFLQLEASEISLPLPIERFK